MPTGCRRALARTALALALAAPVATLAQSGSPQPRDAQPRAATPLAGLRTRAERTDYRETSRYDDVMAFVREVDRASPLVHLTTFGYSLEGRPLPLLVVGRVKDASPAAVRASGLTRVYLQGNIHAGEVEGKEALQMLLREIAQGRHPRWLSSLVLLVAPIYNADGNERVRLDNRPLQNGPLGGVGQRPNAQDLDLNRDHMKLESPEARSLAGLFRDYDPHVGVDLHTTNGTYHAYQLTYAPPLHPNTPAPIVDLLRREWLPAITRRHRERDGWDVYYYGNIPGDAGAEGPERGWYTFDHRPRFNNNYIGLRNRIAILSEAYAYLPFVDRVRVTKRFVEEILDTVSADAARVRSIVEEADRASVVGRTLALTAKTTRAAEPVDILMGGVARVRHPLTAREMLQRTNERRVERLPEYGTFEAVRTAVAPAGYLVPASLDAVIDLLAAHGIRTTPVTAGSRFDVERFTISATSVAARPFQGHRERRVEGTWTPTTFTAATGLLLVPLDQPLGRLAFTLLEPQSDDGVLNWNMLDRLFDEVEKTKAGSLAVYPIVRVAAPKTAGLKPCAPGVLPCRP